MKNLPLALIFLLFSAPAFAQYMQVPDGKYLPHDICMAGRPNYFTFNVTATTPGMYITGQPGSTTTAVPWMYFDNLTATQPTFSSNDNYIGINASNTYSGFPFQYYVNGSSKFSINSSGNVSTAGGYTSSGAQFINQTLSTLNGTTAGNIKYNEPQEGSGWKVFVAHAAAYENNSAVNQTISYPLAFTNTPTIIANDTSLSISTSTSVLTITAPNNTTTFTGNILVEGY